MADGPVQPRRRYWIRFTYYDCPVCGRGDVHRERVYYDEEPKPEDALKRHIQVEQYDLCIY